MFGKVSMKLLSTLIASQATVSDINVIEFTFIALICIRTDLPMLERVRPIYTSICYFIISWRCSTNILQRVPSILSDNRIMQNYLSFSLITGNSKKGFKIQIHVKFT